MIICPKGYSGIAPPSGKRKKIAFSPAVLFLDSVGYNGYDLYDSFIF